MKIKFEVKKNSQSFHIIPSIFIGWWGFYDRAHPGYFFKGRSLSSSFLLWVFQIHFLGKPKQHKVKMPKSKMPKNSQN